MDVTTDPVVTEDGAGMLPPHSSRRAGKVKRAVLIFLLLVLVGLGYLAVRLGPDLLSAYRAGFFEAPPEKVAYSADRKQNLVALHAAIMRYHDSEQVFPKGAGWMDAIRPFLDTGELKDGESLKKLHRPGLQTGQYGYALNSAVLGKYKDDLKQKGSAILLYESKARTKDGTGDPASDREGLAITVDGTVLEK
ncbi:MAG: hypothetical protein JNM85_00350 [Chthonomonas sp.]|nr:hypothetical protein [Chthonomonas sp.]